MTSRFAQETDFTRDVLGRYVCNGLDEALHGADSAAGGRPFDVIIVGGGTFGAVLARELFERDTEHRHRVLVLEGGPFVLPEHAQNLPMVGLGVPGPTSIAELRAGGADRSARNEVWGLAWHSPQRFPGLAYCIGGRSLFWGGWSPRPLDAELPPERWPEGVVADLAARDFADAGRLIGVDQTNDFISGPLHEALRRRLLEGLEGGSVPESVPLDELPAQVEPPEGASEELRRKLKLEAPLAVQARTRPGFFPGNKFSAVPLLIEAARKAQAESGGDDRSKRLMVVPHCHVTRLGTDGRRVTAVHTNLGDVPVPETGLVVLALGTIENARLALLSFPGARTEPRMGANLLAHLRSNLTIRIPREALGVSPAVHDLQVSALFVKGRHRFADGTQGHYHLQVTASGLGSAGVNSEAELFRKVPDVDLLDASRAASDTHVVVTIRGIGEMTPDNPASFVRLDGEPDEFGERRAFVSLQPSAKDLALWDAMDEAALQVADVLSGGTGAHEVLSRQRDGLGTTHHEAGVLRMGQDPSTSVTDGDGRFHDVPNAYVAGPALFPSTGSPNPMLSGVALARRLARRLSSPVEHEEGFEELFDGSSIADWNLSGAGSVRLSQDGTIELTGGDDLGLLWCGQPTPADFVLRLQWKLSSGSDNSGVFVRFPDPRTQGYDNPAYVPVHFGFEVQIDELARPDGAGFHGTGAIYGAAGQDLARRFARPPGWWNEFEIRVEDQRYTVALNGDVVTRFENGDASRGLPGTEARPAYLGLQAYPGSRVAFRHVRLHALTSSTIVPPPRPVRVGR